MKKGQTVVLWIALLAAAIALFFPPWVSTSPTRGFIGYAWLFDPPARAVIAYPHWMAQTVLLVVALALAYVIAGRGTPAAAVTAWRIGWRLLATALAGALAAAVGWGLVAGGLFGLAVVLIWKPRAKPAPAVQAQRERLNWTTGLTSEDIHRAEAIKPASRLSE